MSRIGFFGLLGWALCLFVLYQVATLIYNIFLHPLRKFPGPIESRASRIPWVRWLVNGEQAYKIHDLHKRYGPVVRTAPDELSFTSADAWKDIYGHRIGMESNLPEIPKYKKLYRPMPTNPYSIINAPREMHGALRRGLAHGFSEKSMRDQESIIGRYVDLLMERLREQTAGDQAVNIVKWYTFTTFDVIGDLSVGHSFGCLESSAYHPWVKLFEDSPQQSAWRIGLSMLGFTWVMRTILPYMVNNHVKHGALTKEWLLQRMESKSERPDLIGGLLKRDGIEYGFGEIHQTSSTLLIAGSETTATLLSGVTFYLLKNPDTLAKVTEEVRSSYKLREEITLISVQKLHYMLACLNEALRLYSPVTFGMPRLVPKGGAYISGEFVPENTVVTVPQYAMHHSPDHWTDAERFHPERFLGDPKFAEDKLETLQPFSVGPRNCIGRNLAYAEMRLVLARILYDFDLRLDPSSSGWIDGQKTYTLWKKPALNVHLSPVKT